MLSIKLLRRAVLLAIVWAVFFYTLLLADIWQADKSVLISNAVDDELPLLISDPARLLLRSRITSGDVLIPQLFLNSVNGVDISEQTRQRLLRLAQSFIRAGFDVNIVYEGRTALHYAVLYNEPDTVAFLLENGANPRVRIRRPDHASHDMDALQYAWFLSAKGEKTSKMNAVIHLLEP